MRGRLYELGRAKSQIWDNEDDSDSASEYEPLQISRYAGQLTRDELGAGPSHGDISNTPLAKENPKGEAEISGGGGAKPSEGDDTMNKQPETSIGKGGSVPNVSGDAQSGKLPKKKGERVRRQRLVSYSSQESQDSDGAGSRKSSRKRAAVTKFGGVIIDSIFKSRRNKGEEETGNVKGIRKMKPAMIGNKNFD